MVFSHCKLAVVSSLYLWERKKSTNCPTSFSLCKLSGVLTCLGELTIGGCPKLVSFPNLGFPPMRRRLDIFYCEGLRSLPDWMMLMKDGSNNSSDVRLLEYLKIKKCPSLICFPEGQLPTTLKQLHISDCENLKSLPEGMIHHNSIGINNLEYFSIRMCPSLIGFPEGELPTTLKELKIWRCEKLGSLPGGMMHHDSNTTTATSGGLHVLNIWECPSLIFFPTGKFPSTLKKLEIRDCA